MLRQIDADWFYGRNERGDEGMLPTTYIDIKVPLPETHQPSSAGASHQSQPAAAQSTDDRRPVRALYTFMAQTAGDLSIGEYEELVVLYAINDDWWFGETADGRRGQFPSAYVELI